MKTDRSRPFANTSDVFKWKQTLARDIKEGLIPCPVQLVQDVFAFMCEGNIWPDPRPGSKFKGEDAHQVMRECQLASLVLEQLVFLISKNVDNGTTAEKHASVSNCTEDDVLHTLFCDEMYSENQNLYGNILQGPRTTWTSKQRIRALGSIQVELTRRNRQLSLTDVSDAGALLSSVLLLNAMRARIYVLKLERESASPVLEK